jgi:hypothetical protein
MFLQASRDSRRAALHTLYASSLKADVEAWARDYSASSRRLVPAGVVFVLSLLAAVALLVTFRWPAQWWTDPAALTRIGLALSVVLVSWQVVNRFAAAPAARLQAVEARASQDILPRLFRVLRTGAKYKRNDGIDQGWMRRSALASGLGAHACRHLVRWNVGELRRQFAQVMATDVEPPSGAPPSASKSFQGLVAIAQRPATLSGHVVVRNREGRLGLQHDIAGLPPSSAASLDALGPWRLRDEYVVYASSDEALREALTPDACALLNLQLPDACVHVAFAYGEVFVVLERGAGWLERLAVRLDEAHFVKVAEFMDLVDALAQR